MAKIHDIFNFAPPAKKKVLLFALFVLFYNFILFMIAWKQNLNKKISYPNNNFNSLI